MKFETRNFYENQSRKSKFGLNREKISGALHH